MICLRHERLFLPLNMLLMKMSNCLRQVQTFGNVEELSFLVFLVIDLGCIWLTGGGHFWLNVSHRSGSRYGREEFCRVDEGFGRGCFHRQEDEFAKKGLGDRNHGVGG